MIRNIAKIVFVCVLCILMTSSYLNITFAQSTNYYVSQYGSDNNSGTLEKPFRSIKKACNKIMPGDTIYVRDGVYSERVSILTSGSEDKGYITITNYPGENPILDGSSLTVPDAYNGMFLIESQSDRKSTRLNSSH